MNLFYALLLSASILAAVLIPLHFIFKALPKQERAVQEEKKKGPSAIELALIAAGVALAIVSGVNAYLHHEPAAQHGSQK